ncbi:hypothetical protein NLJ89_g760 [Agrocybe chaxingu]|uniref:Uncharacterized protein n=1 Tax=Agrocybe chaxingu TaxID=84603 RepID=A0A9W8TED9_9AGAR|nr:hypothetical protein NLJ89_g760 [Agrocybe chaxingu]
MDFVATLYSLSSHLNTAPQDVLDIFQATISVTPFEATRRRATGEFKTQHPANDFVLGLHYEDATSDTMAGFVQEPVVSAQDGSSDTSESPHVHPPSQPQNPVLQFAVNNAGANWSYSSSNLAATLKDPLASPEPYNHTAISWGTNDGGLLPTRFGLNRSDLYDATSSAESYGDYSPHSSQPSPPAASLARDSETEYALLPILPNSQGWTRSPGPSIPAPQIYECGALIDTVEAFITHMEAHIDFRRGWISSPSRATLPSLALPASQL